MNLKNKVLSLKRRLNKFKLSVANTSNAGKKKDYCSCTESTSKIEARIYSDKNEYKELWEKYPDQSKAEEKLKLLKNEEEKFAESCAA